MKNSYNMTAIYKKKKDLNLSAFFLTLPWLIAKRMYKNAAITLGFYLTIYMIYETMKITMKFSVIVIAMSIFMNFLYSTFWGLYGNRINTNFIKNIKVSIFKDIFYILLSLLLIFIGIIISSYITKIQSSYQRKVKISNNISSFELYKDINCINSNGRYFMLLNAVFQKDARIYSFSPGFEYLNSFTLPVTEDDYVDDKNVFAIKNDTFSILYYNKLEGIEYIKQLKVQDRDILIYDSIKTEYEALNISKSNINNKLDSNILYKISDNEIITKSHKSIQYRNLLENRTETIGHIKYGNYELLRENENLILFGNPFNKNTIIFMDKSRLTLKETYISDFIVTDSIINDRKIYFVGKKRNKYNNYYTIQMKCYDESFNELWSKKYPTLQAIFLTEPQFIKDTNNIEIVGQIVTKFNYIFISRFSKSGDLIKITN